MINRTATTALAGLLLVGLSACGEPEADAESAAPAYENMDDFRSALAEAGVECTDGESNEQEGYEEAQACGNGFYITYYTEESMRTAQVDRWSAEDDMATAAGANWAVRAKNGEEIRRVAEQLDGVVVGGSAATEGAEPSESASIKS